VTQENPSTPVFDPSVFRDVIGHFATGVTIITTREREIDFGVTVSAVTSLSLEPPMLLVCLNRTSRTGAAVGRTRGFAVNILGVHQRDLAQLFATPRDDKFAGLDVRYGDLGHPLLDAIAHVECEVVEEATGGTHTVFLAEVRRAERFDGEPLLYYRGQLGWEAMGERPVPSRDPPSS
jgi:4-nitrophenol 2-monooxygenase / 4-nitrocatechol 4-monooxygenase, reductase component